MESTRRELLVGAAVGVGASLAGCSEDGSQPGLHAVDILTLHRAGDGWYNYPEEIGVQITVENTDTDRHTGTLVVTLRQTNDPDTWEERRDINLPGGTTRGYRIAFAVDASEQGSFSADARIER